MKKLLMLTMLFLLTGCLGMPKSVTPVKDFSANNYLGTWYEIARLDHSFERGLTNISAQYTLREDGGVNVLNRGFSIKDNEWSEAKGKAYFVDGSDQGYLKVSFFGPFYGSYIIFDLDKADYQYAFVSGPDTSYLWLLSRTPEISPALKARFIKESKARGFDTDNLIFVDHDK